METGSEYMDRILEQPGSRSLISNLSIVEFESVLAINMRMGEIKTQSLEIARRRFRADLAQQRIRVAPSVNEGHFQTARKLLIRYGVTEGFRTLDALQLAVASTSSRGTHHHPSRGRPKILPRRDVSRLCGRKSRAIGPQSWFEGHSPRRQVKLQLNRPGRLWASTDGTALN